MTDYAPPDPHPPVVFDEAQFTGTVHKAAHLGAGRPDHLRQGLLRNFRQERLGASSVAWGRAPGEAGRVAFFTTDGETTALPPDGKVREAKVLGVEFSAA